MGLFIYYVMCRHTCQVLVSVLNRTIVTCMSVVGPNTIWVVPLTIGIHIANITSNCNCAFLITYSRAVACINVLCFVMWLKVENMVSVKSLVYNSLTFPLHTNLRISIHFTAVSKTLAKYPTCFLGL